MIALHEKYGDVVRYRPNMPSSSNPAAIKDIYGAGMKKVRYHFHCKVTEYFWK